MADTHLLLDIRGRNVDALRAIAGTRAAMRSLSAEERRSLGVNKELTRVQRDVNRLLDRQSRSVRALTGDYVALRRTLFTLGIRGAITGFAALDSAVVSLGTGVAATTAQLGLLGAAVAQTGGVMAGGAVQGALVWRAALQDVQKALVTTGKSHESAVKELTKNERELYKQLKPIRKELGILQQIAQDAIGPGLARGARDAQSAVEEVRQAVNDTAEALGYLAERSGNAIKRNRIEVDRLLQNQVVALRRGGDSLIELAEGYLHIQDAGETTFRYLSSEALTWSRNFNRAMKEKDRNGDLAEFFGNAEQAWANWTSTFGSTAGMIFGTLKAGNPEAEKMARSVARLARDGEKWTKSEDGQKRIASHFETMMPVAGELAKAVGATAESLVHIGEDGADSAVRILRGYRKDVLPLFEQIAGTLNDGILQSIIDISRETVEFIDTAQPGLKIIGGAISETVGIAAVAIDGVNTLLQRMPEASRAISSLAIAGGVLVGWGRFKQLLAEGLLSMRQMVGLAPKVRGPQFGPGVGGGVTPMVGLGPGMGGGGVRATGGVSGGNTVIASSRMRFGGIQGFNQMQAPGALRIVPSYARPGAPGHVSFPGAQAGQQTVRPFPFSTSQTIRGGRTPLTRMAIGPRGMAFYPLSVGGVRAQVGARRPMPPGALPPLAPMSSIRPLTSGDPLTGGNAPRSLAARMQGGSPGRFALIGAATANSVRGIASGAERGILSGAQKAAPKVGGFLKIGVAAGAFSGLISAASQARTELGGGTKGFLKNFASGLTFGGVEGTTEESERHSNEIARALQGRKGKFKGLGSDLSTSLGVREFRETYIKALRDGKSITDEQFKALDKFAHDTQTALAGKENLKAKLGIDVDSHELTKATGNVINAFQSMRSKTRASMGDINKGNSRMMREIKATTRDGSNAAKTLLSRAYSESEKAVRRSMRANVISTEKGMARIQELHLKQLEIYGIKGARARTIVTNNNNGKSGSFGAVAGGGNEGGGVQAMSGGNDKDAARGLYTVGRKGQVGPDTEQFNIMAGKGETAAVFTRHQKAIADQRLADMGGLEGLFSRVSAKHTSPMRFAGGGIVGLGRAIQKLGPYHVGEHPAFGGVTPGVHAANGRHPVGGALDINADGARGGESMWLDRLAAWLGNRGWHYLWRTKGHFDHLHVDDLGKGMPLNVGIPRVKAKGAMGAMAPVVQKALDDVRKGANRDLRKQIGFSGMEEGGVGGADYSRAQIIAAMKRAGFPGSELRRGSAIALAESGGRRVQNSIGATGPWQILLSAHPSVSESEAMDLDSSTAYAYHLWQQAGWQPWEAYTNGAYLNYMRRGGLLSAAAGIVRGVPKPPRRDDGYTMPTSGGNKPPASSDPKKKKSKKAPTNKRKRKLPPVISGKYPSGVRTAISDSRAMRHKGKLKPYKPRSKVQFLKYLTRGGKWLDDPAFYDSITGEGINPEDMPMFEGISKLREKMPGLESAFELMVGEHDRTEEFSTLTLEKDDLRRWLASQGMSGTDIEKWIVDYGDSLDVVNNFGFSQDGTWRRGISDAMAELSAQRDARGGVLANWQQQLGMATGLDTHKQRQIRRARLREVRDIFRTNRKVIKGLRKKVRKAGDKVYSWRQQVGHNQGLIDDLREHKRKSRRLPESYRDRIDSDIADLTIANRELREHKPSKMLPHHAQVLRAKLAGRLREQQMISGDEGISQWSPQAMGGIAGAAYRSLENWRGLDEFRTTVMTEARDAIPGEQQRIAKYGDDMNALSTTKVRAPDKINTGADDELKDLQIQQLRDALAAQLSGAKLINTLAGFSSVVGSRFIGAFAHGSVSVPQTGYALVHKGETIVPDLDGPFGNGRTVNALSGGGGGNFSVEILVRTDRGEILQVIDQRITQVAQPIVSQQTGRRSRVLLAAPGRG